MTPRFRSPLLALAAVALAIGCDSDLPTASTTPDPAVIAAPSMVVSSAAEDGPVQAGVIRASFPGGAICGVPLARTDLFSAGPVWDPLPGGAPSRSAGSIRTTWTATNGNSALVRHAGQTTREIVEWLSDDTFVAIQTTTGLAELIRTVEGPVLTRDAGRIVVRLVVQLLPGGGSRLVAPPEFLEVDGPHPDGTTGFSLFCPSVREALLD